MHDDRQHPICGSFRSLLERGGARQPRFGYWLLLGLALSCLSLPIHADEPGDEAAQEHRFTNALVDSTSPYLLQHAHNPVNWMPWGPEAFAKAKRENKPIFVSIGYSTCYWCHVMERESFEDEEVAKLLNDHYVAIKVDREQRPDIDEQLMLATQLFTGRGGWPNSVWLTTDGRPWMAGTYFPKPRFMEALRTLSDVWKQQPEEVDQQAESFAEAIRKASQNADGGAAAVLSGVEPLERAMAEARQLFDAEFGGFGGKPKFPPHGVLRLLAFAAREKDNELAQGMLTRTLDAIYSGGIHDHVAGGFHRYATDQRWFLPHFEKMLYDNAQLMRAYTDAYELTQEDLYRRAVADIAAWVAREMTHERGGFYSAIDSESEGEEGRYYTWSMQELRSVLPPADAETFARVYNFANEGNFTEEATGERPGTNIPFLTLDAPQIRQHAADEQLAGMRESLRTAREDRVLPQLDDKVLASWNGLMISSLARAGRVLSEPRYTRAAEEAAEFVLSELVRDDKLLRTWRAGVAELPGYLEDYAFLVDGLLELHQTTDEVRWLEDARRLTDTMLKQFEDRTGGGFYFTGPDHEELIVRSKGLTGGGNLPVANGVAANNLLELFQRTGEAKYEQALRRTLDGLAGIMHQSPREVEHLVLADARFRLLEKKQPMPAGQADATHLGDAVQAELYVSHDRVVPGQSIRLAVVLKVAEGYHLYAEEGGEPALVKATRVRLMPAPGLVPGEAKSPAGERQFDPVLQQEIRKLKGRNIYTLPAKIDADAEQQTMQLQVEVEYQACDATRCLRPVTAVLEFEVSLAETPGEPRHGQVIP